MSDVLDASEAAAMLRVQAEALALTICVENGNIELPVRMALDSAAVAALGAFEPALPSAGEEGHYEFAALMDWARLVFAECRSLENEETALYRHFDKLGRLLYVGIAFDIYARTQAHNRSHWAHEVHRIEHEVFPTRRAALQAEKAAIRSENPVHNIRR